MNIILYSAQTKLTPAHHCVASWMRQGTLREVWVRAAIAKPGDLADIVVRAKPRKGETVLNAIEL